MATTISISSTAHRRLKKLKGPGESFSDVILRQLPEPCDTCGEVLDSLERTPPPKIDPELEEAWRTGRGRRSSRRL